MNAIRRIKKALKRPYYFLSKRSDKKDYTYVAIVSTGRTGTRFLARFFDQHSSNFLALHEPYGASIRKLSAKFFKSQISFAVAKRQFVGDRFQVEHQLFKKQKTAFLESDGNLSYLLPVIKNVYPKYKIIHIIRNPKDVVRSFCSRTRQVNGQTIQTYAHDGNWPILPKDVGDQVVQKLWPKMSLIEKGAWMWRFRNEQTLQEIEGNPHAITLRFEHIFAADQSFAGLKKMLDFVGCELTVDPTDKTFNALVQQKSNSTKQFLIPTFEEWSEKDKAGFLDLVNPLARQFNY